MNKPKEWWEIMVGHSTVFMVNDKTAKSIWSSMKGDTKNAWYIGLDIIGVPIKFKLEAIVGIGYSTPESRKFNEEVNAGVYDEDEEETKEDWQK